MNNQPIRITSADNRRFGIVVCLVDRPDFLEEIEITRKKLNIDIDKQFSNTHVENWLTAFEESDEYLETARYLMYEQLLEEGNKKLQEELVNKIQLYKKDNLITSLETQKILEQIRNNLKKEIQKYEKMSFNLENIRLEAKKIVVKFKRNTNFVDLVVDCLIKGETNTNRLTSTQLTLIKKYVAEKGFELDEDLICIKISPESTNEEVVNILKIASIKYFKTRKMNIGSVKYESTHNLKSSIPDTKGNIVRDRLWYWQHLFGKSYQEIWNMAEQNTRPSDRDGVIKAIKNYKKMLSVEI